MQRVYLHQVCTIIFLIPLLFTFTAVSSLILTTCLHRWYSSCYSLAFREAQSLQSTNYVESTPMGSGTAEAGLWSPTLPGAFYPHKSLQDWNSRKSFQLQQRSSWRTAEHSSQPELFVPTNEFRTRFRAIRQYRGYDIASMDISCLLKPVQQRGPRSSTTRATCIGHGEVAARNFYIKSAPSLWRIIIQKGQRATKGKINPCMHVLLTAWC